MEKSLKFYKDIFGFPTVNEFGSGEAKIVIIDIEKGYLELVQRPGSPASPPDGNWSHIALCEPDLDGKIKKLEEMGLELRKITMGNGNRLCFFNDPGGHTLELMEKGFN